MLRAVELRHIVKRFPGVVANRDVNLTVRAGTIHAVIGENGAGKSTLMKTLYGMQRPDDGTVLVNVRLVRLPSVVEARRDVHLQADAALTQRIMRTRRWLSVTCRPVGGMNSMSSPTPSSVRNRVMSTAVSGE